MAPDSMVGDPTAQSSSLSSSCSRLSAGLWGSVWGQGGGRPCARPGLRVTSGLGLCLGRTSAALADVDTARPITMALVQTRRSAAYGCCDMPPKCTGVPRPESGRIHPRGVAHGAAASLWGWGRGPRAAFV